MTSADRFVIRFTPKPGYGSLCCFQEAGTLKHRLLRSTTNPAFVARWSDPQAARVWLSSAGLCDGATVPVGIGWLIAEVVELADADLDPAVCRGALFDCPLSAEERSDLGKALGQFGTALRSTREHAADPVVSVGPVAARPKQASFAFD